MAEAGLADLPLGDFHFCMSLYEVALVQLHPIGAHIHSPCMAHSLWRSC